MSLSLDAATGRVLRHASGRSEVVGTDVFAVLEAEIAAGPRDALWVGYLGYASRPDLPARAGAQQPEAVWLRVGPHRLPPTWRPSPARLRSARPPRPGRWPTSSGTPRPSTPSRSTCTPDAATRSTSPTASPPSSAADPADVYLDLRRRSPAPYAGYLQHDVAGARGWLLSASPERFLGIDAERVAEARPIKGTLPRGATAAEDRILAERLASDPKSRAENLMIVDLLRNDLSRVCRPGTRRGAVADAGGVVRPGPSARLGRHRSPAGRRLHGRRPAVGLPARLDDRSTEAADHGDHRRGRDHSARGLLRDVRLDPARRARRPGGGDPVADHRRRRSLGARHGRRHHRPLRGHRGARGVVCQGARAARAAVLRSRS